MAGGTINSIFSLFRINHNTYICSPILRMSHRLIGRTAVFGTVSQGSSPCGTTGKIKVLQINELQHFFYAHSFLQKAVNQLFVISVFQKLPYFLPIIFVDL